MKRSELLAYKSELIVHLMQSLHTRLQSTHAPWEIQLVKYSWDGKLLLEAAGEALGRSNPEERACINSADEAYEHLELGLRNFLLGQNHLGLGWGAKENRYLEKTAAKKEPTIEWLDAIISERHPAAVADVALILIDQIRRRLEDRLRLYLEEDLRELDALRKENAVLRSAILKLDPDFKFPKQKK